MSAIEGNCVQVLCRHFVFLDFTSFCAVRFSFHDDHQLRNENANVINVTLLQCHCRSNGNVINDRWINGTRSCIGEH